jgi:uncharacterized protein YndB with AHSA1/START domain
MSEPSTVLHLDYLFAAPAAIVFDYWTKPDLLATWWGVKGSAVVDCSVDLRLGGRWAISMRASSGRVFHNSGVYIEIEPMRLLRFSDDPIVDLPEWASVPRHPAIHTVKFEAVETGTSVELRTEFKTAAERQLMERLGMSEGMSQGFQRLAQVLIRTRR